MNSREFSSGPHRSRRRPARERAVVFERFSDQARQVVVLAAGTARTHHQHSVGTEHLLVGIFDADGPGTAALTSWGVTAPALESKLKGASSPTGSAPAAGHIPNTGEDEEGPRGQPAPDRPARARRNRHRPPPPGPARRPRLHRRSNAHRPHTPQHQRSA
ncbi:Clp protease N-terminal domain-containing protein [Rhodococcus jostii]|uniref:Clp protease N-terminal domain-containing protein n=1 Tax=Rhodococcus jostii TaxID=132919 RepID=UPI00365D3D10